MTYFSSFSAPFVYKFKSNYPTKLETTLHNKYSYDRCKKGEWFRMNLKDVVDFIPNCKKMEKNFEALKDNYYFNK
jgi:hypothetical protein